MGPDLTEVGRAARCPSCGAALRPGAPWCTLCYADLRPQPVPEPAAPVDADPLSAPLASLPPADPPDPAVPTWPCSLCGHANPLGSDSCLGCGAGFLAALREDNPAVRIPGLGDVSRLERPQRFALAGMVVLAFIVLTVLLGLL